MKKNAIIAFLVIATTLSFFYAFVKAKEAHKARITAEKQRAEIEKMRAQAEQLRSHAEEAAAEALMQMKLAEKALADCKNK